MDWRQQRKRNLEEQQRQSYEMLNNYEQELIYAENPQSKAKLERQISDLKKQIDACQKELGSIEQQLQTHDKPQSSERTQDKYTVGAKEPTLILFYQRALTILQNIRQRKTVITLGGLLTGGVTVAFLLLSEYSPVNISNFNLESFPLFNQKPFVLSSSPRFGINIVACRATFDWESFIKHIKTKPNAHNNFIALQRPTKSPILDIPLPNENSKYYISELNRAKFDENNKNKIVDPYAPYISQGCIRQKNLRPVSGAKYYDFEEGEFPTKAAFGNDLVVGIFPNGSIPAQGNLGNQNRAVISGLRSIFKSELLKEIYSTGGARNGMPRIFSTGPDEYITDENGTKIYQGGWCTVENGRILVKTFRAGEPFDPSLYGKDPNNPLHACARKGKTTVEDQNLQIFQYVYEIRYPTASQCEEWFGARSAEEIATCITFYRNRLGRTLAGNGSSGNRIVYTQTFYGTFDAKYTKWVGWVNPDLNGPRKKSSDKFVQNYDGYAVFVLD